jgi:Flp pilus assembly protein TadD
VNALGRLGSTERARELKQRQMGVLERQLELVPEDVRARVLLSSLYAEFGRVDEAVRQTQTAVALRPNDPNVLYNAACTYGVLNRKAAALAGIKQAFEAGYGNREWAARDPDLNCLAEEPDFQRLTATPA